MANDDHAPSARVRWARLRFQILGPLLAAPADDGELKARIEELAAAPVATPAPPARRSASRSRPSSAGGTSPRGAERSARRARTQGPRRTPAPTRASRPRARRGDRAPAREHPRWTFQLHHDNLVALAREDPRLGPVPGYATVCRYMKEQGLLARPQAPPSRAARRRAVRAARDALVRGHSRPRPLAPGLPRGLARPSSPPTASGKKPQLLGILDDRSRLCCHLQWYLDETAEALIHGLSQAFHKRGLPARSADRQRRRHARRRDRRRPRAPRHRPSHDAAVLARAKRKAGVVLGADRRAPPAHARGRARPLPRAAQHRHAGLGRAGVPPQGALRDQARPRSRATCAGPPSVARAPAPTPCAARSAPRSRATSAAATAPSPSRASASRSPPPTAPSCSLRLRVARWDLSSVDLVDPRSGEHLATLLPLDKARNAERVRRVVAPRRAERARATRRHRAAPARADGRLRRHRPAPCLSCPKTTPYRPTTPPEDS